MKIILVYQVVSNLNKPNRAVVWRVFSNPQDLIIGIINKKNFNLLFALKHDCYIKFFNVDKSVCPG